MTTLAFSFLLGLNVFIFLFFALTVYRSEGPASPLAMVLLFYFFNYPLRAIMLFIASGTELEWAFNSWEREFTQGEICQALLYSTLFFAALVMTYAIRAHSRKEAPLSFKREMQESGLDTSWRRAIFFLLFSAYMGRFAYNALTGRLFSLYEAVEDLKHPFFENLFGLAENFQWFLVAYAFLRILRTKSLPVLILSFSVAATIVVGSLVSTAKGALIALVLLWVICFWLVRGRTPIFMLSCGAVAIIAFAFYSYTARQYDYYGVRSAGNEGTLKTVGRTARMVEDMHRQNPDLWKEQAGRVFSRFDCMDSLILCQRRDKFLGDGLYAFGSVVELGNAIPRFLWPDRPLLSFNHHATYAVWGRPDYYFLEMPIGRIGESFYVWNWGGIFYAFLYGTLWAWIYRRLMLRSKNDLETAFYLSTLFLVILPDAYLLYNWKPLLIVTLGYMVLRSNGVIRLGKPSALADGTAESNGRS